MTLRIYIDRILDINRKNKENLKIIREKMRKYEQREFERKIIKSQPDIMKYIYEYHEEKLDTLPSEKVSKKIYLSLISKPPIKIKNEMLDFKTIDILRKYAYILMCGHEDRILNEQNYEDPDYIATKTNQIKFGEHQQLKETIDLIEE